MTSVVEGLNNVSRTSHFGRRHFDLLAAKVLGGKLEPKPIDLQLSLELASAGLLIRDTQNRSLYHPTELGTRLIENFPTFYLLQRKDIVIETLLPKIAKDALRKD